MYETVVGERTRVIDGAILTGNMIIEEDVFIGPGARFVNDNSTYTARFGLGKLIWKGPTIHRSAFIGAGANMSGGVEIGEGALIAPNAMVTHDVDPWTVVAGVPARKMRDIDPKMRRMILNHVAKFNK